MAHLLHSTADHNWILVQSYHRQIVGRNHCIWQGNCSQDAVCSQSSCAGWQPITKASAFLWWYMPIQHTGTFFTLQTNFVKINLRYAVSVLVLDTGTGTFSFLKKHWRRPCGGSAINDPIITVQRKHNVPKVLICFKVLTPSCTRDYCFQYVSCTQSLTQNYCQGGSLYPFMQHYVLFFSTEIVRNHDKEVTNN